jgi:hypothetical protein
VIDGTPGAAEQRPDAGALWEHSGGPFGVRQWSDEFVVFADALAATHLLDEAAGSVFQALRACNAPHTPTEIASLVSGQAADADEVTVTASILDRLHEVGLARRAIP